MVHATLSCVWFLQQDEPYRSLSSVQVADLLAPRPLLCASPDCSVFVVPCGRQFSCDTWQVETHPERHKLATSQCVDLVNLRRTPGFSKNLCPIAQGMDADGVTMGICWRRAVTVRSQPWQCAIRSRVKMPEIPQWQCTNVADSMMQTLEVSKIGVLEALIDTCWC